MRDTMYHDGLVVIQIDGPTNPVLVDPISLYDTQCVLCEFKKDKTLGEEIPWMIVNRGNGADGKSTMSDLRANLHNEHHAFVTPNIFFKKASMEIKKSLSN